MADLIERPGWFFHEDHRLEFSEYGHGDRWVLLLPGQLTPRSGQRRLARVLAGGGFHAVALDPLGHGGSDRPDHPPAYSLASLAAQAVALLDHLDVDEAVIAGTAIGANVALEVAVNQPGRVRGLVLEMPVLDNALTAGVLVAGPLLLGARFAPWAVDGARIAASLLERGLPGRLLPGWGAAALGVFRQHPRALAAALHGLLFGPVAPAAADRHALDLPVLVVGHGRDPLHPFEDAEMLAEQIPGACLARSRGPWEWRLRPSRLDAEALAFLASAWSDAHPRRLASR